MGSAQAAALRRHLARLAYPLFCAADWAASLDNFRAAIRMTVEVQEKDIPNGCAKDCTIPEMKLTAKKCDSSHIMAIESGE
jgi:hypothetical protein